MLKTLFSTPATPRRGAARPLLLLLPAALLLSACGNLPDRLLRPDPFDGGGTVAGSEISPTYDSLPRVDLVRLLRVNACDSDASCPYEQKMQTEEEKVYYYLRVIRERPAQTGGDRRATRNSIQDTILASADRACVVYERTLTLMGSNSDVLFGGGSTLLGGLSAVFTNVTTARILGGSAGILSGLGAEVNSAFFHQQSIHVIKAGLNLARLDVSQQIWENRSKDVADYTLEAAIRDSVRYAGACSISAALDKVKDQIKEAGSPGIGTVQRIQNQINAMTLNSRIAEELNKDSPDIGVIKGFITTRDLIGGDVLAKLRNSELSLMQEKREYEREKSALTTLKATQETELKTLFDTTDLSTLPSLADQQAALATETAKDPADAAAVTALQKQVDALTAYQATQNSLAELTAKIDTADSEIKAIQDQIQLYLETS